MIVLALLGFVLPVLQGWLFLVIGIVLLGPHDPTLRQVAVRIRLTLRRLSQVEQRHLRRIGIFARRRYAEARIMLRTHLHRHERGAHSWRSHWLLLLTIFIGLAALAGILLVTWQTLP